MSGIGRVSLERGGSRGGEQGNRIFLQPAIRTQYLQQELIVLPCFHPPILDADLLAFDFLEQVERGKSAARVGWLSLTARM